MATYLTRSGKYICYCRSNGSKYSVPLYEGSPNPDIPSYYKSCGVTGTVKVKIGDNYYFALIGNTKCSNTTYLRYNNKYFINGIREVSSSLLYNYGCLLISCIPFGTSGTNVWCSSIGRFYKNEGDYSGTGTFMTATTPTSVVASYERICTPSGSGLYCCFNYTSAAVCGSSPYCICLYYTSYGANGSSAFSGTYVCFYWKSSYLKTWIRTVIYI